MTAIVEPSGAITSRVMPAMTVARTLHVGSYQGLVSAYSAVTNWIRDSHWQICGAVQERYLTGPGDGTEPDGYRTEVEIPIQPALAAAHF